MMMMMIMMMMMMMMMMMKFWCMYISRGGIKIFKALASGE
jgi:hypothetical protein